MEQAKDKLAEVLRQCTVRVVVVQTWGTGFFVAPGHILTCAHVVKSAQTDTSNIKVEKDDRKFSVKFLTLRPTPYPDLALLMIDFSEHPCVYLHEAVDISDELYSYGYTDKYPDGDSALFVYEGPTGGREPLLRLKDAQVRPGLSGAPLLNRRTGGVCGIIKKSRDRNNNMGGRAIPTSTILLELKDLVEMQRKFHIKDRRWINCLNRQQLRLIGLSNAKTDHPRDSPASADVDTTQAQELITYLRELFNREDKIWEDECKVAVERIKKTISWLKVKEKSLETQTNTPSEHYRLIKELQYIIDRLENLITLINRLYKESSSLYGRNLRDIKERIDVLQNRLNSIGAMNE